MIKTEVISKVYDSTEAEYEIRSLKKLGYTRIQNSFWFEYWEKGTHRVIIERDY